MPQALRLFFAIPAPPEVREGARRCQEALRALAPQGSFPAPEGFHLTLAFLGNQQPSRVEEILRRAAPLAAGHAPFPLATAPLGGFPSLGRARVAWLGFQPQPALEALALDLRKALQEGGVTFDPKPFRPHLTLARLKAPARLDPQALDPPPSLSFQVERVLLYRSHLSQQGSRFEALGGVELQGLPGGSGRPVLQ